jgi:large subunit ribosomal protein L21e
VPVSKGYRRKTRSLLRKRKALTGLSAYLRVYNVGDKVTIVIDPSQPKGMPHRRFQGLVGNVTKVLRRVLEIKVKVGNKDRTVIARVEHVKPLVG